MTKKSKNNPNRHFDGGVGAVAPIFKGIHNPINRERSGSVVECLTRDRRAAGSSLTGVTALWSLSKTHLSQVSTG